MARNLKKKAHGLDTILAIVSIFGLAIVVLIGNYTYSEFLSLAKNTTTFNESSEAIAAMEEVETMNETIWDYFILVIFIGFAIAMIVLGYYIDTTSIFFPLFIIVMMVGVIVSAVLSYAWNQISRTDIFIEIASSQLPIANHLLNNLVLYYVVIAGIALVTTYSKTEG